MDSAQPIVTGLYVYPVKSCRGIALEQATLDARGIVHDREWLVVDDASRFLTQREVPRLALIRPTLADDALHLEAPGLPPLRLPYGGGGAVRAVTIWRDTCPALDQGDAAAAWLSDFLGHRCRLVRFADDHVRHVNPAYARSERDQVAFADGYPLLLISEASLQDLNRRLPEPLPMNRFRPNIVVRGCAPYAEDEWDTLRIGEVLAYGVKPCPRCAIPMTDQETARRGKEPLRTLATYRDSDLGILFGQNVIHAAPGVLRVGDAVEVLVATAGR